MIDSREARSHASQIKFVVDSTLGAAICDWARTHLEPDAHGAGPFGDEYDTASLYFDTADLDVFHRRGSYGRAKYRIRRYSNADVVFLERKLRKPRLVVKGRTRVPLDVVPRVTVAAADAPWAGSWFAARVHARRLAPACLISYRRLARGAQGGDSLARLTLDQDILAVPKSGLAFTGGDRDPILPERMILELKFRGPVVFKRLAEEFALRPGRASKYRLGVIGLGHVGAADAGADADELPPDAAVEIRELA